MGHYDRLYEIDARNKEVQKELVLASCENFKKEFFVKDKKQSDVDFLIEKNLYTIFEKYEYKRGIEIPEGKFCHSEDMEAVIQEASQYAIKLLLKEGRAVHCTSGGIMRYDKEAAEYLWERGVDLIIVGTDEWSGYKGLWIKVFNATMEGLLDRHYTKEKPFLGHEIQQYVMPYYKQILFGEYKGIVSNNLQK